MAKVQITLEDVLTENGDTGATFAMHMEITDADRALPPEAVTPAAGVGFAIRSLWRGGVLSEYARAHIDELVEEAALENILSEKNALASVNENIAPVQS